MAEGRYRAEYGKPAGDARCASGAAMYRRAKTAFCPPPHVCARPSASPARSGKLLRSMGKLGNPSMVFQHKRVMQVELSLNENSDFLKLSKPPKAVSQSAGDGQGPCAGYNDT